MCWPSSFVITTSFQKMPIYQITVPSPIRTICISIKCENNAHFVTSFDPSLEGEHVFLNSEGIMSGDSLYFTKDKKQVVWRSM